MVALLVLRIWLADLLARRACLLNRYDWIHLSMLLATPFLISLTMNP